MTQINLARPYCFVDILLLARMQGATPPTQATGYPAVAAGPAGAGGYYPTPPGPQPSYAAPPPQHAPQQRQHQPQPPPPQPMSLMQQNLKAAATLGATLGAAAGQVLRGSASAVEEVNRKATTRAGTSTVTAPVPPAVMQMHAAQMTWQHPATAGPPQGALPLQQQFQRVFQTGAQQQVPTTCWCGFNDDPEARPRPRPRPRRKRREAVRDTRTL